MSLHGISGRVYSKSREVRIIPAPYHAFLVWGEKGVRGRILFLFDRYLNAEHLDTSLTQDNYVYLSIKKNMVREVYHIVPDDSWEEVENTILRYPLVSYSGGVFRMFLDDGSSVFIMRLRNVTPVKEEVLLNINLEYYKTDDLRKIMTLLKGNVLSSDVITLTGDISDGDLKDIIEYEKKR